jgi:hypothetical protein
MDCEWLRMSARGRQIANPSRGFRSEVDLSDGVVAWELVVMYKGEGFGYLQGH